MKSTKPLIILLIQILLITTGCKQTTEPKLEPELKLELEDVSCTEAWINLRATNLQLPANVTLYKNSVAQNNILCYGDTLLYVDSLLPNQTYKFKSIVQSSNQQIITSSNELTVTTMDTTSHDFTWQSWEFGQHSSSTLYDVAIIDENNIWAVGEIYMLDSLGRPDPNAYNAVHWDGTKWELKRIYHHSQCNPVDYPPFRAIWAFSDTQIILTSGGSIGFFNGKTNKPDCSIRPLLTGAINKLWGSSSSDLYAVGNNGNIAHWDGRKWTKIESGTTLNINDIWGDYNEKTGQWEILAVAANYGSNLEKEILLLENNHIQKLSTESNPLMEPLLTTWFVPNRQYYVAGAGIYQKHLLKDSKWKNNLFNITTFATTSIRGNNINDIIGVGAFGDFVHFNGINWKNNYAQPSLSNGSYSKVALKGNLIVAVGGNYTSINSVAVILLGRR
ncbi:Hypothetical protein IALB_2431 [Ignavibacterium album JCM 16511]|uniref:Glucosyl transferase n=1 Tax=Ignavibacterium album (strain DSM 19864 / JCM 16511 / NBRC 101810 / Mat9-16) TaxID=945713 RepID=I0AMC7_IGNAJ|nr:hypothetical protein [Ignavibacterium album]AFH50134.1 Hypothetical protein IALB_2431 [Ignavibacterium album JCM 16511]